MKINDAAALFAALGKKVFAVSEKQLEAITFLLDGDTYEATVVTRLSDHYAICMTLSAFANSSIITKDEQEVLKLIALRIAVEQRKELVEKVTGKEPEPVND